MLDPNSKIICLFIIMVTNQTQKSKRTTMQSPTVIIILVHLFNTNSATCGPISGQDGGIFDKNNTTLHDIIFSQSSVTAFTTFIKV
jgi:hypothetical protein